MVGQNSEMAEYSLCWCFLGLGRVFFSLEVARGVWGARAFSGGVWVP